MGERWMAGRRPRGDRAIAFSSVGSAAVWFNLLFAGGRRAYHVARRIPGGQGVGWPRGRSNGRDFSVCGWAPHMFVLSKLSHGR